MLMRIGLLFSLSWIIGLTAPLLVFMMLFAGVIGYFVHRHPTVKMLALSFLTVNEGAVIYADCYPHQ